MEKLFDAVHEGALIPLVLVVLAVRFWLAKVMAIVPEPYLDEFFHVHQAQLYLQDRWDVWHPKITTPPGLYLVTYLLFSLLNAMGLSEGDGASMLRYTTFYGVTIWFPLGMNGLMRSEPLDEERNNNLKKTKSLSRWSIGELNHTLFNICVFPPLFFFYGLYYTDVVSAQFVLLAYNLFSQGRTKSFVLAGLCTLFFRQTNIFWVSVFFGGLKVCRSLPNGRPGIEFPESPTILDVVEGSWQHSSIYNPLVSQAWFEDYLKSGLSIAIAGFSSLGTVLGSLIPHLFLLGAFGLFVIWNQGVVLGDKENHVASIHLPQMLYIWPYFMFFSFPLLYPYMLNGIVPLRFVPRFLHSRSIKHQFPRLVILVPITAAMLIIVHYNTIVHPFTLADNRHYMFYVFRLLLRHPLIKYASVSVYVLCAWATVTALGGLPNGQKSSRPAPTRIEIRHNLQFKLPPPPTKLAPGNRVSFVLVWLLATSLSLITAPLVEPRYFIIPWFIWRMHIPRSRPESLDSPPEDQKLPRSQSSRFSTAARSLLYEKHDHRLWLETAWFLVINWVTGYIFLYWGFEWPQEPGKVQRFIW